MVSNALAVTNLTVIGTIKPLNAAVLQVVPAPAIGDFAPVSFAIEQLRAHPAVEAAMLADSPPRARR